MSEQIDFETTMINYYYYKTSLYFIFVTFLNNKKQFERTESTARTIGLRTRNKQASFIKNQSLNTTP